RTVRALPEYSEGGFVVQDPAQALVVRFAAFSSGELVWDACGAPGGKARVLGERCRVVASDARQARLAPLVELAARGAARLFVLAADTRQPPFRNSSMDAVLLDVPCSATGTIARHPDARWRLTPRRIAAVAQLQRALLEGAATVPRPGGLLVYATCSLEPEENEQQVNDFLERHPDYRRTADDLSVFPADIGTDGAYAARLQRVA
ncbi:MAG: RsmB/NOP family class I SAM-dependent RNA methyltransferase, partial [Gemmatimonadetes bacterium]|nr:RsmB/NOP family class I SAM-dependent RNA methyltransferase [Gemmatimonadota bacterium]